MRIAHVVCNPSQLTRYVEYVLDVARSAPARSEGGSQYRRSHGWSGAVCRAVVPHTTRRPQVHLRSSNTFKKTKCTNLSGNTIESVFRTRRPFAKCSARSSSWRRSAPSSLPTSTVSDGSRYAEISRMLHSEPAARSACQDWDTPWSGLRTNARACSARGGRGFRTAVRVLHAGFPAASCSECQARASRAVARATGHDWRQPGWREEREEGMEGGR